ncbi:hypothetical protein MAR_037120 [Mya arenaria]|uniref:60S ribosomal protein L35 n=1 Tax=Mya arenaria TaxID=6604 RepID=A0ABY7FRW1_MYAAR|nr:hypothetical protein MAR_037120 [Mya arenaria]
MIQAKKVINEAVNNSTPRRKKALIKKGIILSNEEKLKIESESKIVVRVKRALKQLKHQQTKEGQKRYQLMTCSLVGRAHREEAGVFAEFTCTTIQY